MEHTHLFEKVGNTWACWGHDDACGLRAPACFTPVWEATTRKGKTDLVLDQMMVQWVSLAYQLPRSNHEAQ